MAFSCCLRKRAPVEPERQREHDESLVKPPNATAVKQSGTTAGEAGTLALRRQRRDKRAAEQAGLLYEAPAAAAPATAPSPSRGVALIEVAAPASPALAAATPTAASTGTFAATLIAAPQSATLSTLAPKAGAVNPAVSSPAAAVFNMLDRGGDGLLTLNDVRALYNSVFEIELTPMMWESIMRGSESGRAGGIDLNEFVDILGPNFGEITPALVEEVFTLWCPRAQLTDLAPTTLPGAATSRLTTSRLCTLLRSLLGGEFSPPHAFKWCPSGLVTPESLRNFVLSTGATVSIPDRRDGSDLPS